jgi:hypothetical protein
MLKHTMSPIMPRAIPYIWVLKMLVGPPVAL